MSYYVYQLLALAVSEVRNPTEDDGSVHLEGDGE